MALRRSAAISAPQLSFGPLLHSPTGWSLRSRLVALCLEALANSFEEALVEIYLPSRATLPRLIRPAICEAAASVVRLLACPALISRPPRVEADSPP
jgi:hypothetical protein